MADKLLYVFDRHSQQSIPLLLNDNGDGSYSLATISGGHISVPPFVEFTRENNATPYIAGDVISPSAGSPVLIEVPNAIRKNGGSAYIIACQIVINIKSLTNEFRVHLFNSSDPVISGDNLPYKESYSDISKYLGYFDMPGMETATDTTNSDMSRSIRTDLRHPIKTVVNSKNIWFLLQTKNNVTLSASSKISVQMLFDDN